MLLYNCINNSEIKIYPILIPNPVQAQEIYDNNKLTKLQCPHFVVAVMRRSTLEFSHSHRANPRYFSQLPFYTLLVKSAVLNYLKTLSCFHLSIPTPFPCIRPWSFWVYFYYTNLSIHVQVPPPPPPPSARMTQALNCSATCSIPDIYPR